MIEKMLEKIEELRNVDICAGITCAECEKMCGKSDCAKSYQFLTISKVKEIVQEVAKEYGKDTNVPSNDLISRSVLLDKLQKWKFANEERGYDTASDLVQEMIDLVKEQKPAPYQKGE